MQKNHLRLVVSNKEKNFIQKGVNKLWQWLNEPRVLRVPGQLSYAEKKEAIKKCATLIYADYQATTGEIGLFPLTEAENFVKGLEQQGLIESFYQKHKRRIAS